MRRLDKSSRGMNNRRTMTKPLRVLKTIPQIIRAYGEIHLAREGVRLSGKRAMAEWADIGITAICNWETDNYIPQGWHYRIHLHLQANGYVLDPSALGVKSEQAVKKLRAA